MLIARLFRQIGGHSSRFVPFCFLEDFTIKMTKIITLFFLKNNHKFFLHQTKCFIEAIVMKEGYKNIENRKKKYGAW